MTATLVKLAIGILLVAAVVAVLDSSAPADVGAATASPSRTAAVTATATARPSAADTFLVTVNEDDLTKSAAAGFPRTVNGVTVSDPQVRIESDRVRLVARAKLLFGTAEFVMTATPTVSDGRLDVRVDSATLAGFSVPSDTRASIQQAVQTTIAQYVPASVRVTSVSLARGSLTVRGTQR